MVVEAEHHGALDRLTARRHRRIAVCGDLAVELLEVLDKLSCVCMPSAVRENVQVRICLCARSTWSSKRGAPGGGLAMSPSCSERSSALVVRSDGVLAFGCGGTLLFGRIRCRDGARRLRGHGSSRARGLQKEGETSSLKFLSGCVRLFSRATGPVAN